ncbi:hypothetical protein [Streptomyces sp. NPDC058066]|uniref:hypothetical protein n=1 Tax=Streptomyces sp. NPDC058066 TaxID=3346323 RepID=UPI0036E30E6D
MDDFDLRAVALGQRLFRLLQGLDPNPPARPLLAIPISTPAGISWDAKLSEAAVERLTDLIEAVEARPRSGIRPPLYVVPTSPEVAS